MAGISNNEKGKTAKFFEAFSPFLCLKYRGLDNQNCLIPVIPPTGLVCEILQDGIVGHIREGKPSLIKGLVSISHRERYRDIKCGQINGQAPN